MTLHEIFASFGRHWQLLREVSYELKLVRFSLFLGAVGMLAVLSPQGQEVLIAMGETGGSWGDKRRKVLFVVTTLACAFAVWYYARLMYRFKFGRSEAQAQRHKRLRAWLPRLLGVTVLWSTALATGLAAAKADASSLWALTGSFVALSIAFLAFTIRRRRWRNLPSVHADACGVSGISELPWGVWGRLTFILILVGAISTVITFQYAVMAPVLGAASIILLAATLIIPMGTTVDYIGNQYRFASLSVLAVWVLVCSFWVDNHRVRLDGDMATYDAPSPPETPTGAFGATTLESYVNNWLKDRAGEDPNIPIPVIIVAAEGGGVRAAYWTGLVLAGLQDEAAQAGFDFSRYVLGISGVSGGALGGAVFSALINSELKADAPHCQKDATFLARAHTVLSQDFLSPTLAVMLFPDLQQRFVPWAFVNDRAFALETAWEQAFNRCEQSNVFGEPFVNLWRNRSITNQPPLLFINSTAVESGQRLIMSPFHFPDGGIQSRFADALDGAHILGDRIPLSTAVHLSARFTYVSPAGTVRRPLSTQGARVPEWFRLVDGGYFENSGAVTGSELLKIVHRAATNTAIEQPILPMVLQISNDPADVLDTQCLPTDQGQDNTERSWLDVLTGDNKRTLLPETLAPLKALLAVRPARGAQARCALHEAVRSARKGTLPGLHVHFQLRKQGTALPLGWTLSDRSQDDMRYQLLGYPGDLPDAASKRDNRAQLELVLEALSLTKTP